MLAHLAQHLAFRHAGEELMVQHQQLGFGEPAELRRRRVERGEVRFPPVAHGMLRSSYRPRPAARRTRRTRARRIRWRRVAGDHEGAVRRPEAVATRLVARTMLHCNRRDCDVFVFVNDARLNLMHFDEVAGAISVLQTFGADVYVFLRAARMFFVISSRPWVPYSGGD